MIITKKRLHKLIVTGYLRGLAQSHEAEQQKELNDVLEYLAVNRDGLQLLGRLPGRVQEDKRQAKIQLLAQLGADLQDLKHRPKDQK
jgi:hypothetical protein